MPLHEIGQRRLDQGFLVVTGVGQDVFVLDDLEIIDAQSGVAADELDRLQGAIADIDPPGETGGGHLNLLYTTSSRCGRAAGAGFG